MSSPPTLVVRDPQPSPEEVERCAELCRMALAEAGYPRERKGRASTGEIYVDPVPYDVLVKAQRLAATAMGWDFEINWPGAGRETTVSKETDADH